MVFLVDAIFLLALGSFLLTIQLPCLQWCFLAFLLTIGAIFLTTGALILQLKLFCLQWESMLRSSSMDCKQGSSTASKKARTGSRQASPYFRVRALTGFALLFHTLVDRL